MALSALEEAQAERLRALLHDVLSEAGQRRADAILSTEAALGVLENNRRFRDPGLYALTVFGSPDAASRWALRFEGHHLSVNLTFAGDTIVSVTPIILGANPETIPDGHDRGMRALGVQVDLARQALSTLSPAEREAA